MKNGEIASIVGRVTRLLSREVAALDPLAVDAHALAHAVVAGSRGGRRRGGDAAVTATPGLDHGMAVPVVASAHHPWPRSAGAHRVAMAMMASAHHFRRGRRRVAVAVVAVADLGARSGGRRGVAVPMMPVADLGAGHRRRVTVPVMPIADLGGGGHRLDRVAMAVMAPAHLRRLDCSGVVVMAVVRSRLRCAADEGDRRGDKDDREAVERTDHAVS
jgi:hypothetical protein